MVDAARSPFPGREPACLRRESRDRAAESVVDGARRPRGRVQHPGTRWRDEWDAHPFLARPLPQRLEGRRPALGLADTSSADFVAAPQPALRCDATEDGAGRRVAAEYVDVERAPNAPSEDTSCPGPCQTWLEFK